MEKAFFTLSFGFLLLILLMQHAFAAQGGNAAVTLRPAKHGFIPMVSSIETQCFWK